MSQSIASKRPIPVEKNIDPNPKGKATAFSGNGFNDQNLMVQPSTSLSSNEGIASTANARTFVDDLVARAQQSNSADMLQKIKYLV